jgi:hypothetical protein
MIEHEINSLDNFMGGWIFDDVSICDELIKFHETSPNKTPGKCIDGVNKEFKDSIDCGLSYNSDLFSKYTTQLNSVALKYIEKYPWCNYYNPWGIISEINIQHYAPGGGYFGWHTERGGTSPNEVSRHLVFMTYLNDVTDAGETEWANQKLKIKPQKGLTVIWPTDWTFTHRGVVSPTQDKYIATGWFHYLNAKK